MESRSYPPDTFKALPAHGPQPRVPGAGVTDVRSEWETALMLAQTAHAAFERGLASKHLRAEARALRTPRRVVFGPLVTVVSSDCAVVFVGGSGRGLDYRPPAYSSRNGHMPNGLVSIVGIVAKQPIHKQTLDVDQRVSDVVPPCANRCDPPHIHP